MGSWSLLLASISSQQIRCNLQSRSPPSPARGSKAWQSGAIAGESRFPRGIIEFAADESLPHHNPVLKRDASILPVCGLGGQAALAGHGLKETGSQPVTKIGWLKDWQDAGGLTG